MFVVNNRKWFYTLSGTLIALSLLAMLLWGFNLGIDFKGGSLLEIKYSGARPPIEDVRAAVTTVLALEPSVRSIGESGYIFRMRSVTEPERQQVLSALVTASHGVQFDEERFDSIGPLLGKESAHRSLISIALVLIMIVLFIAFAFRKVSQPVSSWKYGIITVLALAHDVIIPTGVFVVLGHFIPTIEIDSLFVTAILVILGFSVHDTIVVFDRVRENLKFAHKESFDHVVGKSISQTFTRSINTSLTVVLALLALYFVGSSATHTFTLALLIGVIVGTYSSIFIGSPLLVSIERWQNRGNDK